MMRLRRVIVFAVMLRQVKMGSIASIASPIKER